MFKKEAEEKYKEHLADPNYYESSEEESYLHGFEEGAEFGYKKGFEDCAKARLNVTTISDCPIKDEWHYVKDGDLPKEDLRPRTLGYYLTASKHKSYKGFVFEVAYFTGVIFTKGGDILDNVIAWKEIIPPKEGE